MKFDLVVFDLDGTLMNSGKAIFSAVDKAFRLEGIKRVFELEDFEKYIGLSFPDMFMHLGQQIDDYPKFLKTYKTLYLDYIDVNTFFPFALDLIKWLREVNVKIALLTTKTQEQADLLLHHFSIHNQFNLVMGRRDGIKKKPFAEPLEIIMNELDSKPEKTLMVGDTELDIQCAKNANVSSCAVTFGYRTIKQIKIENPDYIINDLNQVKTILSEG